MTDEKKKPALRYCRYCAGEAVLYTRDGRNFEGMPGYIATVRCQRCLVSITAFSSSRRAAEIIVRDRWNGNGSADRTGRSV